MYYKNGGALSKRNTILTSNIVIWRNFPVSGSHSLISPCEDEENNRFSSQTKLYTQISWAFHVNCNSYLAKKKIFKKCANECNILAKYLFLKHNLNQFFFFEEKFICCFFFENEKWYFSQDVNVKYYKRFLTIFLYWEEKNIILIFFFFGYISI